MPKVVTRKRKALSTGTVNDVSQRHWRGSARDKLVGHRVSVQAHDDLSFYPGTVVRFNYYREQNRHYVHYDDGEEDWEDLSLQNMGVSWHPLPDKSTTPSPSNVKPAKSVASQQEETAASIKNTKAAAHLPHPEPQSNDAEKINKPAKKERIVKAKKTKSKVKHALKKDRNKKHYRMYKGTVIDPEKLWNAVEACGGIDFINKRRKWQLIRMQMGLVHSTSSGASLKRAYKEYFIEPGHFCERMGIPRSSIAFAKVNEINGSSSDSSDEDADSLDEDTENDVHGKEDNGLVLETGEGHVTDPHMYGEASCTPPTNMNTSSSFHFYPPVSPVMLSMSTNACLQSKISGKDNDSLRQLAQRLTEDKKRLALKGKTIDPGALLISVVALGGIDVVRKKRLWQQVRKDLGLVATTSSGSQLSRTFSYYFGEENENLHKRERDPDDEIDEVDSSKRARLTFTQSMAGQQRSNEVRLSSAFPSTFNYMFTPIHQNELGGEMQSADSQNSQTSSIADQHPHLRNDSPSSTEKCGHAYATSHQAEAVNPILSWSPTPFWSMVPSHTTASFARDIGANHQRSTGILAHQKSKSGAVTGEELQFLQELLISELDPSNESLSLS